VIEMKTCLAALIGLLTLLACGPRRIESPDATPAHKINTDYIIRLVGRSGAGHACPVWGTILTAAHMLESDDDDGLVGYVWSDRAGGEGFLSPLRVSRKRDLGEMYVLTGVPIYYKGSTSEPDPGDTLHWVEYAFDDEPFALKTKKAKLVENLSGHLVMDTPPEQGGSGSCVLNDSGEVVGIVVWTVRNGGVAVSIAGPWWPRWQLEK